MTTSDLTALVGRRVKELRTERGLSLSGLAAAAGVGKGSLSELESGIRNPTLATLYALAGPLGVPLGTLLLDTVGTAISSPGITGRLLDIRRTPLHTRELYTLDIDPGVERISPAHGPGVVEILTLTSGTLWAGPVAQEQRLTPGMTSRWISDREHRYRSERESVAAVLVVITPLPPQV